MSAVSTLLSTIVTTLLSWHALLYTPVLPPLPVLHEPRVEIPEAFTLPVTKANATQAAILAKGVYAVDQTSGQILFARNPDLRLFPASTTKIMTALIALEEYDPTEVASVGASFVREGRVMGLLPGEQITVGDLIAATLVHSANDAADVLAKHHPDGEQAFIALMNHKAKDLHMVQTTFTNPSGLFDPRHVTSVRDLVHLTRAAMQQPTFAALVRQEKKTVTSVDGMYTHQLETTNKLLGNLPGIEGVKTGYTQEAGECLVTQVTRDGHTVITVMLQSPDRFGETRSLIEWVYGTYTWETKPLAAWVETL